MDTRGLILTFTGNGKGKTTAALGMAFRAWGQGMKVLILQFIKGGWKPGELKTAEELKPNFEIRQLGLGFIINPGPGEMEKHKQAARQALETAANEIMSGDYHLIILDEIFYGIKYGFFETKELLSLLKKKPPQLHLVLTGRNAPEEIIEESDLVTEMKEIKHPYMKGIPAQRGVEF
ncbi:cob(I)yrinic acid a,c-diamide adenosyltransferase [Desulfolucanica intricata]|uniref:cob(I)yrinic acid a,c-diamide adenosyltransferase n=1 Tax=Desulfolucanica intricata TaxID=1285191 RepID=UPI00082FCE73|nr:cob(I)yrinic acid a,c-diamide adenosyltransferase [Desulfolucanica intricata]